MNVTDWVRSKGGVVRTAALMRVGVSGRVVSAAVAGGSLHRPRRGWVATTDADPELVSAARAGVVLTCITQARRLGLWVLSEEKPHVGASPHSGTVRVARGNRGAGDPLALIHWAAPVVPRLPGRLVDPIENVLLMVAACRPFEEALVIWESALRMEAVDRQVLERLPLSGRARAVLDAAWPFSDSGLESLVMSRLAWLRVRIVAQAWILGHRVDFLIGERLVLQIDGGTHVGRQREEDIRHDARLMLAGYRVIRVGYRQVVGDWPSVQDIIVRAVAQGLHRAT